MGELRKPHLIISNFMQKPETEKASTLEVFARAWCEHARTALLN